VRLPLAAFAVAAVLILVPTAAAQSVDYPDSMASTGDSITRAFNTGLIPYTDAPRNSWSTGSRAYVLSHYRRILAVNSRIFGRNFNDARSGAKMAELERQMQAVNTQGVEYVTVLMGANDVCASSEAAMTPVSEFRAQFERAMNTVTAGSPSALVYVVSIPDVYRLWLILQEQSHIHISEPTRRS
jgi:lysophospholipase L1-like esterase